MATATDSHKDLRDAYAANEKALTELATSVKAVKIEGSNVEVHADAPAQMRKMLDERKELRTLLDAFDGGEEAKTYLAQIDNGGVGAVDAAGRARAEAAVAMKSLGEMFTDSDAFADYKSAGAHGSSRTMDVYAANIGQAWKPSLKYRDAEKKDIYTAAGGTYTSLGFGTVQNDGLVLPAYRTQRIRDLFPNDTTAANMIVYMRRSGYVNNARVVAERTAADGTAATGAATDVFGLKPLSNLTYTEETARVQLIAHLVRTSKTVLDDEPRLQSVINGEMLYGLRLTEDAEVLYGDGTGSHLLGIMQTPGIQAYAAGSGPSTDYKSDVVRRALTLVQIAYYEATGVVLHPFDWEAMELEKDSQNRYVLVTNVAVGAQQMVWRNPVVATPAMQEGQFLTGAFGLGAKLYDREQAGVQISTEDSDNFQRNAVTIRAEERLALEVTRPESFVKGTF